MRIIVADDDPQLRRLLAAMLQHYAVPQVLEAPDAETALRLLVSEAPSGITIDLDMPGMGGLELARRIRAAPGYRDLPLLVVSASTDPAAIAGFAELGVHDYLLKPLQPAAAGNRVQGFVAHCRVYARLKGG